MIVRKTPVESEVGRLVCSVGGALGAGLKPKEILRSNQFTETMLLLSTHLSYRDTTELLNRCYHRDPADEFKVMTQCDLVSKSGAMIQSELSELATCIFKEEFPDMTGTMPTQQQQLAERFPADTWPTEDEAERAQLAWLISRYNEGKEPPLQITGRDLIDKVEVSDWNAVYISADEVGVKHQKDQRKDGGYKKGKIVENTVIHVEARGRSYILTGINMKEAMRTLLAFLIRNDLLVGRSLYFFTDGAQNIRRSIEETFSFAPYTIILDWFHLDKRMYELLSMALKGSKETKHRLKNDVSALLWAGNVGGAISYLKALPDSRVRNQERLAEAIAYLERKRPYIACSALRSLTGLRNSSNPAEKANDIIVAERQKHNGMSWSYSGSCALASVSAVQRNGELHDWIHGQPLAFRLSDRAGTLAA